MKKSQPCVLFLSLLPLHHGRINLAFSDIAIYGEDDRRRDRWEESKKKRTYQLQRLLNARDRGYYHLS